ncbi:hypothetical protein KPG66_14710 [Mycetohabitans sp. B2]|uniref:hypothetical protein n=1 Tax=Mycetohabitans sp. B2 TaxID=2841274 RepID=UPI001F245589|nr:hypothetical protein [Mycetohabitans sp. B2]MCF7697253.1 hypothetical protein [Mycetohabitans sp. B2]
MLDVLKEVFDAANRRSGYHGGGAHGVQIVARGELRSLARAAMGAVAPVQMLGQRERLDRLHGALPIRLLSRCA